MRSIGSLVTLDAFNVPNTIDWWDAWNVSQLTASAYQFYFLASLIVWIHQIHSNYLYLPCPSSFPFLPFPSTFFLPFPPRPNTCSYPSSCSVAIPWSLVVYMIPGVVTGAQIAAALQGRFTKGETAVMTSSACVFSCLWMKNLMALISYWCTDILLFCCY